MNIYSRKILEYKKIESIHPTHTCFDDIDVIFKFLSIELKIPLDRIKIVHGIINPNNTDKLFSHAWVTGGSSLFDCAIVSPQKEKVICKYHSKNAFKLKHKIVDETQYTIKEAVEKSIKYNCVGPWEQRYRELCEDSKQVYEV